MSNLIRTAAALFSALGALYAFPALAASACPGSFRGSLIRPLPQPVTVELSLTRQNPENARLADEFADGLRDAGVTVSPSGNLRLGLSFLIHNRSDRGGAQQVDFAWMEHLPAKAGSATIALTAMLVSPNDAAFVWVGSLECVIQTTSKDELARYIGTVIGRDLGRDVKSRKVKRDGGRLAFAGRRSPSLLSRPPPVVSGWPWSAG